MNRNNNSNKTFAAYLRLITTSGIAVLILILLIAGQHEIDAQKTSEKSKRVSTDNAKNTAKTENEVVAAVKAVPSRIEVKTGDEPPLLTLVVGQVTTIKLHEEPLEIKFYHPGINITQSNANSINKNVYLIPVTAGIRRNLVIETASGIVEFQLQSIAVENGKTVPFTREVEVKSPIEEKKQKSLEIENASMRDALATRDREAAAAADRVAQAVQKTEKTEMKNQAELLFALAKEKKGRVASSQNKDWEVSQLYSIKNSDGSRILSIFEIEFRGKTSGRFLEVKSEAGTNLYWQSNSTQNNGSTGDGITLKHGERVKVAVIEVASQAASRGLVFVSDGDIVKF